MKRLLTLLGVLALAGLILAPAAESAEVVGDTVVAEAPVADPNVCPDGVDGWTKVDDVPEGVQTTYDLYYEGVKRGTATTNDPSKGLVSVSLDPGWTVDLCVKGGVTRIFVDGLASGENSAEAPVGGSGNAADVSHFSYRLIPPQADDQWCSPGFWRNNYGAWGPTGYSPDDPYNGTTMGEVLANPKKYARTGDFEAVADLLSAAHPDVDFNGDRVADSCPLSADAAKK